MNCRFIIRQLTNISKQNLSLHRPKSDICSRFLTTNIQPVLTPRTRQWAIKRYALLVGLPITMFAVYHLWTKSDTKRKHWIILQSIARAARATSVGLRSFIDQEFSLLFKREGTDEYQIALQACRHRNAKRFANLCIDIGGVYIKIGQAFINLPEVIPVEYYEELQILQERALRREKEEIDGLFKRYFRDIPENVYGKFNRNPVAAASLAEVYDAETKDGQRVAVKVQYSDLRERYETDIATVDNPKKFICLIVLYFSFFWMRILFHLMEWFNPTWTLAWMLDELHDDLTLELDFLHEARNAARCREHLKHLDYVLIPKVHWNYTKKRILTYDFIDGIAVDNIDELKKMNLSLKDIDEKLIRIFAEQIFRTGFVHADPHPGNVHIQINSNKKSKNYQRANIILLDHGIYENLLSEEREILCELWMASIHNDHIRMKQTATALGAPDKDYELFCTLVTMKPLPEYETYQIPSYALDWDPLPKELQMYALKHSHIEMPSETIYKHEMTDKERDELRRNFRKLMNKKRLTLSRILKQMPKTMFLLLRNLNSVRNTLKLHNVSDVDRTRIMTDVCQQALKEFQTKRTRL